MTFVNKFIELLCILIPLIAGEESDVGKTPIEIIRNRGFPEETHYVTTDDGYILSVNRIPHGRFDVVNNGSTRPPVLIFHGLFSSSADFVAIGPRKSLAFYMADSGYDVWLLNARGNTFSRNHTTINPDLEPRKFFNFSWHEMGVYDVPNTIDYILAETNQEKLFYIGHSQGGASFFVMTSMKPEYNEKIRFAALLAPAVFINECEFLYRLVAWQWKIIDDVLNFLDIYQLPGRFGVFLKDNSDTFCRDGSILQEICPVILYVLGGKPDYEQLNKTQLPVIFTNFPSNSAVRQIIHFAQIVRSGIFRQYDFGRNGNLEMYGSASPPAYNLSSVSVPVAIFYGKNDIYLSVKMSKKLIGLLPNLVYDIEIPYSKFNHIDHLFAIDALQMAYSHVLKFIKKY